MEVKEQLTSDYHKYFNKREAQVQKFLKRNNLKTEEEINKSYSTRREIHRAMNEKVRVPSYEAGYPRDKIKGVNKKRNYDNMKVFKLDGQKYKNNKLVFDKQYRECRKNLIKESKRKVRSDDEPEINYDEVIVEKDRLIII